MNPNIKRLKKLINESNHIVFFGGAGVSVPSGIPDFRSAIGIFSQKTNTLQTPEEMVSHSFFMNHPEAFFKFYFEKMVYLDAKPNDVHQYLAILEKTKQVIIITQNIDGLHQIAGSSHVLELHGSIHRNYCMRCNKFYSLQEVKDLEIPRCSCGGIIKPDVVLYQENLNQNIINNSIKNLIKADLLIVGGTSLSVYPAAGLLDYYINKPIVSINKDRHSKVPSTGGELIVMNEDIDEIFKQLMEELNG